MIGTHAMIGTCAITVMLYISHSISAAFEVQNHRHSKNWQQLNQLIYTSQFSQCKEQTLKVLLQHTTPQCNAISQEKRCTFTDLEAYVL